MSIGLLLLISVPDWSLPLRATAKLVSMSIGSLLLISVPDWSLPFRATATY